MVNFHQTLRKYTQIHRPLEEAEVEVKEEVEETNLGEDLKEGEEEIQEEEVKEEEDHITTPTTEETREDVDATGETILGLERMKMTTKIILQPPVITPVPTIPQEDKIHVLFVKKIPHIPYGLVNHLPLS